MTKEQFIRKLKVLSRKIEDLEHDNKALWHIIRTLEETIKCIKNQKEKV